MIQARGSQILRCNLYHVLAYHCLRTTDIHRNNAETQKYFHPNFINNNSYFHFIELAPVPQEFGEDAINLSFAKTHRYPGINLTNRFTYVSEYYMELAGFLRICQKFLGSNQFFPFKYPLCFFLKFQNESALSSR